MDDSMIGRWLDELPMSDPARKRKSRPMLRRFDHHSEPINFLERLGEGAEGIVYRATIRGAQYAVKIVCFAAFLPLRVPSAFLSKSLQFKEWSYTGIKSLTERQRAYTSSFSHECRAFARLDSYGKNGTWAVHCHGWLKLSDAQFRPLRKHSNLTRWAIVKDYIPNKIAITDVPEIRRKMAIARKALLHPQDVQPRNFRGSFIVDLGRVKTYPYPRPYWSNTRQQAFFPYFDKAASDWQVCVRDGEVIEGWINRVIMNKPSPPVQ
ncbi:hypothetical protein LOZ53_002026 [Ophidiomyces ophidiicola]|nr:hypothetical protein LOZ53_002026 [Ophidiomyces ophidiicola]